MISQMNQVQDAARMAMDHRAARPLRRKPRQVPDKGRLSWTIAAIVAALLVALVALFV